MNDSPITREASDAFFVLPPGMIRIWLARPSHQNQGTMMPLSTPESPADIAWEGELEASAMTKSAGAASVTASLGKPEIWRVEDALENHTGQPWVPPQGNTRFWLVRLACTLHPPRKHEVMLEAKLSLALGAADGGEDAVYAFSLFPEQLEAEEKHGFKASLGPKLKFAKAELSAGEIGVNFEYRKVFPVITAFGAGEAYPYWIFQPHASAPLIGSQFVYAVVGGDRAGQGEISFTVTVDGKFGPLRLGLPRAAVRSTRFELAAG